MSNPKKIGIVRWGIIGPGRIAHQFAQDMRVASNGVVEAVASRAKENAVAFADKYGIPLSFGGYDAMLADDRVDAVYVATPHTFHLEHSVAAMEAGKAVLCEKPLTADPEQCRELIAAAGEHRRYLLEAMWTWFLPAIRKAEEWIAGGRIGAVKHLKADFGYPLLPFDPASRAYNVGLGGGAVLDMGVYPVALAWLLFGRGPDAMHVVGRQAPNGVEDDVVVVYDYGDATATLGTSFRCRLRNTAHIIGDEGYIVIPDFFRASRCELHVLDELVESFDDHRKGRGFEFEIEAAGADILAGRLESERIPLAASLAIQEQMAVIRAGC